MEILLIAVGGAAGSVTRYSIGKWIAQRRGDLFPWGTFFVNVTGAVLLGLVIGLHPGQNLYFLLAEGFLGAYTTFSTFMYEGFEIFRDNEKKNAVFYILFSLAVGVAGYFAGAALAACMI
jgi:CrcB protein